MAKDDQFLENSNEGFCILLRVLSTLLEEPSLATALKAVYFIYILLPLHVSVLVGHHHVPEHAAAITCK
jgi:hypothetical protein